MKRKIYFEMKSLAEARDIFFNCLDYPSLLENEEIPTTEALGRILAGPGRDEVLEIVERLLSGRVARQEREVPMVVRIVGTNAEEAARLLREAAFETAATLDEAAAKAVAAARQATAGAA